LRYKAVYILDASLFSSIVTLAGLQMTTRKFLTFLGVLIIESYAAAGFGMFVGTLVPSVDAGLAVAPAVMVLFIVLGGKNIFFSFSFSPSPPKNMSRCLHLYYYVISTRRVSTTLFHHTFFWQF
jgi:hypothetical protein